MKWTLYNARRIPYDYTYIKIVPKFDFNELEKIVDEKNSKYDIE